MFGSRKTLQVVETPYDDLRFDIVRNPPTEGGVGGAPRPLRPSTAGLSATDGRSSTTTRTVRFEVVSSAGSRFEADKDDNNAIYGYKHRGVSETIIGGVGGPLSPSFEAAAHSRSRQHVRGRGSVSPSRAADYPPPIAMGPLRRDNPYERVETPGRGVAIGPPPPPTMQAAPLRFKEFKRPVAPFYSPLVLGVVPSRIEGGVAEASSSSTGGRIAGTTLQFAPLSTSLITHRMDDATAAAASGSPALSSSASRIRREDDHDYRDSSQSARGPLPFASSSSSSAQRTGRLPIDFDWQIPPPSGDEETIGNLRAALGHSTAAQGAQETGVSFASGGLRGDANGRRVVDPAIQREWDRVAEEQRRIAESRNPLRALERARIDHQTMRERYAHRGWSQLNNWK